MRYLAGVIIACVAAAAAYFVLFLALAPAPIAAEYWVREMIVVKREVAREHAQPRKLIVAGGSATLFGVDTAALGSALGVPALNFGLHGSLSLARILQEAGAAATLGDGIILALEPELYCRGGPNAWQIRAAVAWDHEQWRAWSLRERVEGIAVTGPVALLEVAAARAAVSLWPGALQRRLAAFDDRKILARFAIARAPQRFAYSAYHLDALGNLRGTDGSRFHAGASRAEEPTRVCAHALRQLEDFARRMRAAGVAVRFAHAPYALDVGIRSTQVEAASQEFVQKVSVVAPVLDSRVDTLFTKDLFFNSALHLNARGREIRTRRLAEAIRRDRELCAHVGATCAP